MAEWYQSPRYLEREAAGEVVTPGLVDWGGLINAFNAPYNERVAREAAAARAQDASSILTPGGGRVTGYTGSPSSGVAPKTDRNGRTSTSSMPYYGVAPANFTGSDPFNAYVKDYAPAARPASLAKPVPKSGTTYFPQSPSLQYGYNTLTGDYEVKRAGQAYTSVKAPVASTLGGKTMVFGPSPTTPSLPSRMPLGRANGRATGGGMGSAPQGGSPYVDLTFDPSDKGAQGMADSEGKPIRTASGKIFIPGGKGPQGPAPRAPAPGGQPRQPGLMGLFSGLFGGQQGGGGLFGGGGGPGLFGGGGSSAPAPQPTYTTTQFQQDNFQTTAGAQMPSSMNNSRWTTGY